jgi:hypothetical protein
MRSSRSIQKMSCCDGLERRLVVHPNGVRVAIGSNPVTPTSLDSYLFALEKLCSTVSYEIKDLAELNGWAASFQSTAYCLLLAERVGFEPTVEETPTHALQACLLDHSSTSPRRGWDSNPRSDITGDRFSRAAP